MPLDYSKWDAIELSDDSDIEVHPNVDKRSFIRAKQAQIHQQRAERHCQISSLNYDRVINEALLKRIEQFSQELDKLDIESVSSPSAALDDIIFQYLVNLAKDSAQDTPPDPPENLPRRKSEVVPYSKMMATLIDQIRQDVDKVITDESGTKETSSLVKAFKAEAEKHRQKILDLQVELAEKLAELNAESKRQITSEDIHTGFDFSHVAKKTEAKSSKSTTTTQVELLNPGANKHSSSQDSARGDTSNPDNNLDDNSDGDITDDNVTISALGREMLNFSELDFMQCSQFMLQHPQILKPKESDGLLVEAFNFQMDGKSDLAKRCVHHALLLQYCRQLGANGVQLFFKRITTPNHQAQNLFYDDVNNTYERIRDRTVELLRERENDSAGVEQIQLQAADPSSTITIRVPEPITNIETAPPELVHARQVFESFPADLREALEHASLDETNAVLAHMTVSQAEEIVTQLGELGILNLEEGIIDATTDEGKAIVETIEKTGKIPSTVHQERYDLGSVAPSQES